MLKAIALLSFLLLSLASRGISAQELDSSTTTEENG